VDQPLTAGFTVYLDVFSAIKVVITKKWEPTVVNVATARWEMPA
jgi:hypothetical protein